MGTLGSGQFSRDLLRSGLAHQHINPKLVISSKAEVSIILAGRIFFVNKISAFTANISLRDLGPVFKPSTSFKCISIQKINGHFRGDLPMN